MYKFGMELLFRLFKEAYESGYNDGSANQSFTDDRPKVLFDELIKRYFG